MLSHLVRFQWRIRNFDLLLRHPNRGATAVEYALMVALIAIVVIVAVRVVGTNLSGIFNKTATSI